jgi:hypothetical protein
MSEVPFFARRLRTAINSHRAADEDALVLFVVCPGTAPPLLLAAGSFVVGADFDMAGSRDRGWGCHRIDKR